MRLPPLPVVLTPLAGFQFLHLRKLLIAFVAQLGIALGGDEEFFGLLGEGLHQRVVADLAHNEVAVLWLRTPYSIINAVSNLLQSGSFESRWKPFLPASSSAGLKCYR